MLPLPLLEGPGQLLLAPAPLPVLLLLQLLLAPAPLPVLLLLLLLPAAPPSVLGCASAANARAVSRGPCRSCVA